VHALNTIAKTDSKANRVGRMIYSIQIFKAYGGEHTDIAAAFFFHHIPRSGDVARGSRLTGAGQQLLI
jgi:hypothetical protein